MKNKIVKLAAEKDEVLFENSTISTSQVLKIFFLARDSQVLNELLTCLTGPVFKGRSFLK